MVVDVMPKPEILDPQGQAVAGALGRLGIAGVADVRQGKHFELEVDDAIDDETLHKVAGVTDVRQGKHFELEVDDAVDDDTLHRIAGSLLANPVIEDWRVTRA